MRIVFVGAVDFSRHCLREVLRHGGAVVAVLTRPVDKPGIHSDFADLAEVADPHGVPVHRIGKISAPETVALIRDLAPDVMFVFGWSQIISKEVLDIPPMGCIGTHPALLPRNRGRHPLIWALVEGLEQSGLTFFFLDEGVDSGDILWQRPFEITLEDDAGTLYKKIKALASEAIAEFLPLLTSGAAPRMPQDHSQATHWHKRTKSDGEIDWSKPSLEIYNLIRALTRPYPGAHTFVQRQPMTVWRADIPSGKCPPEAERLAPGTVVACRGKRLDVRTGDGCLTITEFEPPEGVTIAPGTVLESEPEE